MFGRCLAWATLCVALGDPSLAGDGPLTGMAQDILETTYGAPSSTRLEVHQRLRDANDAILEAAWELTNVRLRPSGGDAIWPSTAKEHYDARDCVALSVARSKVPGLTLIQWMKPDRAAVREATARTSFSRRISLRLAPTTSLAVDGRRELNGEVAFFGRFVVDAEVASKLVRLDPAGTTVLPGLEPEGTLGRLVPDEEVRTIDIDGTMRPPSSGTCPQIELTARGRRSSMTLSCRSCPSHQLAE